MSIRQLRIGCEFVQQSPAATPVVMQIRPIGEDPVRVTDEQWTVEPTADSHGYTDMYGNRCLRLVLPAGRSHFRYSAIAVVPDEPEPMDPQAARTAPHLLPDATLVYTLPSRYVLPEMLAETDVSQFNHARSGYATVQAVCDFVHQHLTFSYGTSTSTTTSHDVYLARYGVCRDFTHLAIAFCRALDIPARYVFGYLPQLDVEPLPDPMDFAAWMEVWLGDRWWTFDPRNNVPRIGRVLIAQGRDAADVSLSHTFGPNVLKSFKVWTDEVRG